MRSVYSFDHPSLIDDARRRDGVHDVVIHDLADFDRLYAADAGDGDDRGGGEPPDLSTAIAV